MSTKTKKKKAPVVIKNGLEAYIQVVEDLNLAKPRVTEFYQEGIRKAGRDVRKVLQESIKMMKALRKDIADVSRALKEKGSSKKSIAKKPLKSVSKKSSAKEKPIKQESSVENQ